MTRVFAIDWDNQELRLVIAHAGRRGLQRLECVAVPWDAAEQQGLDAGSFDAAVALLAQHGVGHGRAILCARRQHLETLRFNAPPATDDELPVLVENQVSSETGGDLGEILHDYLPLDDDPESPRRVAITLMEKSVAEQYGNLATQLKLTRPRLSVRAAGAFAAAQPKLADATGATLIVVSHGEEVELAVAASDRLHYWRSVYCSPAGDSESFRRFLDDEVVRTLAVAEESLPENQPVTQIAVFAGSRADEAIVRMLRETHDLPVAAWPVVGAAETTYASEDEQASLPGRFAPLLGLLELEAQGHRPAVDLLNPPKRVRPQSSRRTSLLAAAGVVAVLGAGAFMLWEEVAARQDDAARLAQQLKGVEEEVEKLEPQAKAWQAVSAWNDSQVVWLDELRDLSLRFPPPGTAVVLDFNASPTSGGGAVIRLSGKALDPTVVTTLDQMLRDDYREVLSRNLREQATSPDDPFVWRFESLINILRRPASTYRMTYESASASSEAKP